MKVIGEFLAFLPVWFLSWPFRVLPYGGAWKLGQFIAALLWPLAKKHRGIASENLKHAFPDKDEEWRKKIVRQHFRHLGRLMADVFYKPRMNRKFFEKYIIYDGNSHELEKEIDELGKGAALITGHVGSWENLVQYTGAVLNGAGIYKIVKNRFVEKWFRGIRETSGIALYTMEETSGALKAMRKGKPLGLVTDQNAGRAGVFMEFFNRPASTYKGAALLSYLAGAPMYFFTMIHEYDKGPKLRLRIQRLPDIDRSIDKEEAILKATQNWVDRLQAEASMWPEQYFWVHRRWKTKPEDVGVQYP